MSLSSKVSLISSKNFFSFGSESLSEVLIFEDAASSWSLRSNYSSPVKYHNAPKDQLCARGGPPIPLEAPTPGPRESLRTPTLEP